MKGFMRFIITILLVAVIVFVTLYFLNNNNKANPFYAKISASKISQLEIVNEKVEDAISSISFDEATTRLQLINELSNFSNSLTYIHNHYKTNLSFLSNMNADYTKIAYTAITELNFALVNVEKFAKNLEEYKVLPTVNALEINNLLDKVIVYYAEYLQNYSIVNTQIINVLFINGAIEAQKFLSIKDATSFLINTNISTLLIEKLSVDIDESNFSEQVDNLINNTNTATFINYKVLQNKYNNLVNTDGDSVINGSLNFLSAVTFDNPYNEYFLAVDKNTFIEQNTVNAENMQIINEYLNKSVW